MQSHRINQTLIFGRLFFLPTLFLVLNLIDVLTTKYGLSIGLVEMNPLFSAIIPGKIFVCAIFFATSYFLNRYKVWTKHLNDIALIILIVFYVVVVLNNLIQLNSVL
jgi:hypothetical protein